MYYTRILNNICSRNHKSNKLLRDVSLSTSSGLAVEMKPGGGTSAASLQLLNTEDRRRRRSQEMEKLKRRGATEGRWESCGGDQADDSNISARPALEEDPLVDLDDDSLKKQRRGNSGRRIGCRGVGEGPQFDDEDYQGSESPMRMEAPGVATVVEVERTTRKGLGVLRPAGEVLIAKR